MLEAAVSYDVYVLLVGEKRVSVRRSVMRLLSAREKYQMNKRAGEPRSPMACLDIFFHPAS